MSHPHDAEIRKGLSDAGLPSYVLHTTLRLEEATQLRELITTGVLRAPRGLFLHPANRSLSTKARRAFYVTAKELFLTGHSVYCIPLSRLASAVASNEAPDNLNDVMMIDRVQSVFILDFYEDGAPFPLEAWQAAKLRSWARSRVEAGGSISVLSDGPPTACALWWPASFIGFLCDNATVQVIS